MHHLYRDPQPPSGLGRYQHGQHQWSMGSPTPEERQHIWDKLDAMQGHRCAYCEATIGPGNREIEHFRQRSRYPQGTFDWYNLFGSCKRVGSCGDHKDKCGPYTPADLIKPDTEEPEALLVFAPDGSISPRTGLAPAQHQRAVETIRILNLNGALRQIRRTEIAGYVQTAEEFAAMAAEFDEGEWWPLLQQELETIANLPFATAIRHILTPQNR